MQIDLRSDTVTKPTAGMLEAMMTAEVGDDVFGEDPTVKKLEEKCAKLFGMDHAVFCPSGTMTNQIGINILSNPYDEVICYEGSHIYKYEGGGIAGNSGLSFKLIPSRSGKITREQVEENLNGDDIHFPKTAVVSLENTVNKAGGTCYSLKEIEPISAFCKENDLNLHLDGARLFNALINTGDNAKDYGQYFDTISLCLSKGLGAPVGSVLLCKEGLARMARRRRKVFGGGMRQSGYLAAAGIYALDNHIERMTEDHKRAGELGDILARLPYVEEVYPVETNIVIFRLPKSMTAQEWLGKARDKGLLAVPFGKHEVRLVTHLDFQEEAMEIAVDILKKL